MKRKNSWLYLFITLMIFIFSATTIYGEEDGSDDDQTLAPYFFIDSEDPTVDHFALKETTVSANINGVIAEIYVTQIYTNEGQSPINASYVFPASSKVSVHGMNMEIGNQVVTAKIQEREEAKEVFEQAKSDGKSASLLEQQRPNVFTMNVANIMPGDNVRIELHYSELIVPTEGIYQFVFPTVVGPRYQHPATEASDTDQWISSPYLAEGENPAQQYDLNITLSTGVPIAKINSTSHDIKVTKEQDSVANITLSNPEDFAGNRDFILDYQLTGEEVSSGLMLGTSETENFFMLMIQPPERVNPEDIPAREYIFVLDVSGSMEGYPLDTAKELIGDLVTNLNKTDMFNLVLFSNDSIQMSTQSVAATSKNVQQALDFIDQQYGGGGTELAPALERAIAIPEKKDIARSIVVITDGYMSDEKEIFQIIGQHLGTTDFFSFGIGTSVNRYLIDGMAKAGLGESFIVTNSEDATDTAKRFRTYIQSPILTDINVTYQDFDTYDIEPANLPTLFAQRPIIIFGKWRGERSGSIQITGKTGQQDYIQNISLTEVTPLETNNAIRYLWARTKIERLTDYGINTDDDKVKKEVTEIGLNYHMMTAYTSFVAVIETIRNENGNGTDVNQPLPLPLHVSNLAIGGGYTIGSEPKYIIAIFMLMAFPLIGIRYLSKKKLTQSASGGCDEL